MLVRESSRFSPVLIDGGLQGGKTCISEPKTGSKPAHILSNIDPEQITLLNERINLLFQQTNLCASSWLRVPIHSSTDDSISEGAFLQSLMLCKQISCTRCNVKGGSLHSRRKRRIIGKLKNFSPIADISLGKYTFTCPLPLREAFKLKDKLLALKRGFVEIVRKRSGGSPLIVEFHPFGDDVFTYAPHFNIAVVKKLGSKLRLDFCDLASIRSEVKELYLSLGLDPGPGEMNFRYEIADTTKRVFHYLKYVSRPVPDAFQIHALIDEMNGGGDRAIEAFSLLWFILMELYAFQYVSYPNREWEQLPKKIDDRPKRFVLGKPEKIKMSMREFFDLYRSHERTELRPGVYLVIPYKLKKEVPDDG